MRDLVIQEVAGRRPNKAFGDQRPNGDLAVELYIGALGLTYHDSAINSHFAQRGQFSQAHSIERPWLQEETDAVVGECLEGRGVVRLVGDLGVGKSTIFYGARGRLREQGKPYVYIDGHFTNRPDKTLHAIQRMTRNDGVVMFDSLDHLFLTHRESLRLGVRRPGESRAMLLPALQAHVAAGGGLIFSSHTSPWFRSHSTPEHEMELNAFAESVDAAEYRAYGMFGTAEKLAEVCGRIFGPDYAGAYVTRAIASGRQTAMSYRVAKLAGSIIGVESMLTMGTDEFAEVVDRVDDQTRTKMGASPDYALVPGLS